MPKAESRSRQLLRIVLPAPVRPLPALPGSRRSQPPEVSGRYPADPLYGRSNRPAICERIMMPAVRIPLAHALLTLGLLIVLLGSVFGSSNVSSGATSCGRPFDLHVGSASPASANSASASPAPTAPAYVAASIPPARQGAGEAAEQSVLVEPAGFCGAALANRRSLALGTLLPGITLLSLGIWPTARHQWQSRQRWQPRQQRPSRQGCQRSPSRPAAD